MKIIFLLLNSPKHRFNAEIGFVLLTAVESDVCRIDLDCLRNRHTMHPSRQMIDRTVNV